MDVWFPCVRATLKRMKCVHLFTDECKRKAHAMIFAERVRWEKRAFILIEKSKNENAMRAFWLVSALQDAILHQENIVFIPDGCPECRWIQWLRSRFCWRWSGFHWNHQGIVWVSRHGKRNRGVRRMLLFLVRYGRLLNENGRSSAIDRAGLRDGLNRLNDLSIVFMNV